ncbi:hypothetical protein GCM10027577_30940 [Spirosoma fluminis]
MPGDFLSNPERSRYESVPTTILDVDLRQHFYLTPADIQFLMPLRGAVNQIGAALQLGLLRLMGYLPDTWWQQLSPETVQFVAGQLRIDPIRFGQYGHRQQTRSDHFTAVLKQLGFRKWEPLDVTWLEPWLLERALEHDEDRLLLAMTCLKLRQQQIVRPAISTLERLVGSMSEAAHQETYRRLTGLLTENVRSQLDGLLLADTTLKITPHRWLVQQPVNNNPAAINQTLDKLTYLRAMGFCRLGCEQPASQPAEAPVVAGPQPIQPASGAITGLQTLPGAGGFCGRKPADADRRCPGPVRCLLGAEPG